VKGQDDPHPGGESPQWHPDAHSPQLFSSAELLRIADDHGWDLALTKEAQQLGPLRHACLDDSGSRPPVGNDLKHVLGQRGHDRPQPSPAQGQDDGSEVQRRVAWDDQFYPDGVGAWMAKLDADPAGGLTIDESFFPHGEEFRGLRVHQIRLQGGDASSDSYCYS